MANNLVFIVMDSCRHDSYVRARRPNMDLIQEAELRYSFATWTAPSHQSLFMGQVPHASPRGVFASEVYKKEYLKWVDRLGIDNLSFKSFVPDLSLAKVLKGLGYRTVARVSMPVLNPFSGLNRYYDDYKLMHGHNEFAAMVEEIEIYPDELSFHFLNLGETHYPYMLSSDQLPRISGVHGVVKDMDNAIARSCDEPGEDTEFFSADKMQELHAQQVRCVEYVDGLIGELYKKCPDNTYFIITSDHGELFGEGGYFGHGPIMHDKCFEVPFLEGMRP